MSFLASVGFGTAAIVGYGDSIGRPIKDNAYNTVFWLQTLFLSGKALYKIIPNNPPKSTIGITILAIPFMNAGLHLMGQSTGRVVATVFGPPPSPVATATGGASMLA